MLKTVICIDNRFLYNGGYPVSDKQALPLRMKVTHVILVQYIYKIKCTYSLILSYIL